MIWLRRSLIFLGLLLITVADLSLTAWPQFAYSFFFSFTLVALISLIQPLAVALRIAIVQGCLLDLFSASPFGVYMISAVLLVCCTQVLQYSWLKQRTAVHTLLISLIGILIANGTFFGLHILLYYFRFIDRNITNSVRFFNSLIGCIIANAVIFIITRYWQRYDRSV